MFSEEGTEMRKTFFVFTILTAILGFSQMCRAQSFLENEAGISAFCKLSSVNLAQAATAYKNIEYQTSDYIVGSVAIANYPESDDAHVYLHLSGDMIAYYLNQERVAKIIDWKSYYSTGVFTGSKLETALKVIANAMAQNPTNIKYYDFRFPQAKNIRIVLEEARGVTETFRILIPSSYLVYNGSFSHAMVGTTNSYGVGGNLKLDNSTTLSTLSLGTGSSGVWKIAEGELSPSQLSPDLYHTFSIEQDGDGWGYVVIVLLYTEP